MEIRHLTPDDGPRLAYRLHRGEGPALVFLPGYRSDMAGGKATALLDWATASGRTCLLFDYSGCGESGGQFADGTPTRWADEAVTLVDALADGPVILVGSSMGGWLMLLAAETLGARVAGLVGIAAAPDFTDWGYDEDRKARLAGGETVFEDNAYGPEPTPTHAAFWQDGQTRLLLGGDIEIDAPVRLLQGQRDSDVPADTALRLAAALRSDDVQVTLVKDGDHRLSRPQDIRLLLATVEALCTAEPA